MPSTLKDFDKIAWGWTEHTDPKLLTLDNLLTAYRLKQDFCKNKSCRRNCRGNPFCLSGLGESHIFESLNNPVDDVSSALPRRNDDSFVGLKNLGATCYVNSLLQLWFHNKAFRDAIFAWKPEEDPSEKNNMSLYSESHFAPETGVGHLQQLFGLMYYSKCRYIDPSPLVKSLGLDTSTQQDAQEFSNLFITLLEGSLRHQSLKHVKNMINDIFRGEYEYITRCCKCSTESVRPSKFYELELNVKGHHMLTDCLAEFLQEEKLEGADSYSCATCQAKQEAYRFIKIRSLPPILNLQLLRFVYDREKNQRKKLKSVVQFPEVLDMKDFVALDSDQPMLYNLSAVLVHKGARASSGHFIAYIRDATTGSWNSFNDESVVKLEGKKLKLDEEDPENSTKPKAPRLPKGFQSSTDAYMLVYTSENHNPSQSEVKLPQKLQEYVDSKNKIFDDLCRNIAESKKEGIERQERLLGEYNCLTVNTVDLNDTDALKGIDALSVDWLTSWLDSKNDLSLQIDNTKLLCPHNRLDPCSVISAKYVWHDTANSLFNQYGGGPQLTMSDAICEACVANYCLISRTRSKTLEESREITNLLKKRMAVDERGFYVSKYCLKTWRTKVLNQVEEKIGFSNKKIDSVNYPSTSSNISKSTGDSSEPSCPTSLDLSTSEGSEDIKEPGHLKAVCTKSALKRKRLHSSHRRRPTSTVTVPLSDIRDCFVLCQKLQSDLLDASQGPYKITVLDQCKKLKGKLKKLAVSPKSAMLLNNLRRKSRDNSKVNGTDSDLHVEVKTENESGMDNSVPFDESEKNEIKGEEEEENKSDDQGDSSLGFNESLRCPHGYLSIEESDRKLVPVRVWEILKQYFPQAPEFPHDTEPCLSCQNLASKDEVEKQRFYEGAINQKKMFSNLLHLRNRPQLGKTSDTIYILHKHHFYQPWSAFLKLSTRREGATPVDPPASLKVGTLLCEHGCLHYSPHYEDDLAHLVLVTSEEWSMLTSLYTTDAEVTVAPDLTTIPDVCESCFSARLESEQKEKLNYDRAKLFIRMVVPSTTTVEDLESPELPPAKKRPRPDDGSTSPIPPELKKAMKSMASSGPGVTGDVRRSSRNRKIPGQKDVSITVSSSLTLRELKEKIMGQLAVAPFDQHLFTQGGKELFGDFSTLSELEILPNTILFLQVDEAKESFDDVMEECSTPTEPEAGFKGTGLLRAY